MISEVVVAVLENEEKKTDKEGKSVQYAQVCISSTLLFMDCRAEWPASKDKRSRRGEMVGSES